MIDEQGKKFVILGGGPAGLTAGYELIKYGLKPIVIEKLDKVGGIARTENYKGFYFDMGGHRFFTKLKAVQRMWKKMLGSDFLNRPRLSRIYYQKKFFYYPLKMMNALIGVGPVQAVLVLFSYIRWQLFPYRQEDTFEQWVTNRFGKRLFEMFFKTYTEKVWGVSCSVLKAEFAAQRIKDLSLKTAILSMVFKPRQTIKTLIEAFDYPRLGPGMLWERVRQEIERNGGAVLLNSAVNRIFWEGNRITAVEICRNGQIERIEGTDFISSIPVSDFIKRLSPAPADVLRHASLLSYRDFITVCLIVDKPNLFPDNWIYIHEPNVKVGRIQNFKNWSPEMLPDLSKTSLGMEYFCNEGDELWNMTDADLVEFGKHEIDQIGLAKYEDVEDGTVFRVEKAYPIYDEHYREHLKAIREFTQGFDNFQTVGRNGLHRYNNQDHSMLTAMLAVRNLVLGEKNQIFDVNGESEYHEAINHHDLKKKGIGQVLTSGISRVFSRMDPIAFGFSIGITTSLALAFATLFLVIKGGSVIGPNLQLLFNFMPGYRVNAMGSLLGMAYGFIYGFILGYGLAYLRNLIIYLSVMFLYRDIERTAMRSFLDYL